MVGSIDEITRIEKLIRYEEIPKILKVNTDTKMMLNLMVPSHNWKSLLKLIKLMKSYSAQKIYIQRYHFSMANINLKKDIEFKLFLTIHNLL